MRLFFDENISFRILKLLRDDFEAVEHVSDVPMVKKDIEIWQYAKDHNLIIVTFDEDFYDWQLLRGFPPKIIWLRMGNTPTKLLADRIISAKKDIRQLQDDPEQGVLELY